MLRYKIPFYIFVFITAAFFLTGCTSSKSDKDEADTVSVNNYEITEQTGTETGDAIFKVAFEEQQNEMYQIDADSTTLYWLNDKVVHFSRTTKCNIFALNTIHKAGFMTPDVNTLSRDLFDDSLFTDIMPVIEINDPDDLRKGDLIVWRNHVIIFEKPVYRKNTVSVYAIWAGTSQKDNGTTILNNVIYGKYPLKGEFVVRRPVKRKKN
ncbi:MAG: hypothetical protein NTV87_10725 [Ignavibacteriae bacterium]|nr:hypothetical protein [Ignavibacteriota bacterium]